MDYQNSREGARALLRENADLVGIPEARIRPDLYIDGCWLAEARDGAWKALVYLGGHPLADDFEVVEARR